MSRTPVTVAAYKRFVEAMGPQNPIPRAPDFNRSWTHQDHPMVGVTWEEAAAYCKWVGGRLPTEAEWEYAARGGKEDLIYPWGNEISEEDANYDSPGTTPVRAHAPNDWGLYDVWKYVGVDGGLVWQGLLQQFAIH